MTDRDDIDDLPDLTPDPPPWLRSVLWCACGVTLLTALFLAAAIAFSPNHSARPLPHRPILARRHPANPLPNLPLPTRPTNPAATHPVLAQAPPAAATPPPSEPPSFRPPPPPPPPPPSPQSPGIAIPGLAPPPPTATTPPTTPPPPAPAIALRHPHPPTPARILNRRGETDPDALDDDQVTTAINHGADALLLQVKSDLENAQSLNRGRRTIREASDYQTGEIALGVYALLTAGRVNGDPRLHFSSPEMKDAVAYLLAARPTSTYVVALQASALAILPNRPEFRRPLLIDRDNLLRATANGIYTYSTLTPAHSGDNSNTQYGQLGIWACQDAGLEIPLHYWIDVDKYWRDTQFDNGSWGYAANILYRSGPNFGGGLGTSTMTAAGVASLFLALDDIDRSVRFDPKPDRILEAGLKWLTDDFPDYQPRLGSDLYLAYGIERVALAGGIKTLGNHDWYRQGAAQILDAQLPDGSWTYNRAGGVVGTAYALLFLSRGIAPVAFAKLQYDGPWNARSRDAARLTHWLDKQTERTLRWEILPITSNPDDWRNVPILLITGHGDPGFTLDQLTTLRHYVLNGGLIFSSADRGDPTFTRAIRQNYAPAIFGNKYEMLALPANHPAYQIDYQIPPEKRPHLYALSNGVRDVWIHSDDDISASWQAYATAKAEDFEIPANLYFYATGRSSARPHLEPLDPPKPPPATRTITIARLDYSGNPDPEPAAWQRFAADARLRFEANIQTVPTRIVDLDALKTPIAHITGTTRFQLSTADLQKLAEFFDKGGVLLADSAGGSEPFTQSFKATIATLFPNTPFGDLPADSPVYTGNFPDGEPIKALERRHFAELGRARNRSLSFMELRRNNRPIVLFSQGDLTAGITGIRDWNILGYTPETTVPLTWNALLYLAPPTAP